MQRAGFGDLPDLLTDTERLSLAAVTFVFCLGFGKVAKSGALKFANSNLQSDVNRTRVRIDLGQCACRLASCGLVG